MGDFNFIDNNLQNQNYSQLQMSGALDMIIIMFLYQIITL